MAYFPYAEEKKIPIPLALVVLLAIVVIPLFTLSSKQSAKQEKETTIEQVAISNVSHNSATISWQTKERLPGYLFYGEADKKISSIGLDDRDLNGLKLKRTIHYVTLKNLSQNTSYNVKLKHNDALLNFETDYEFKFQTTLPQPLAAGKPPLYGKVVDNTSAAIKEALVFVKIKNAALLSTYTKDDGSFLVSLCCLIHEDSHEVYAVSEDDVATITIKSDTGETSKVVATLRNSHPLSKTIVLGQNENFIVQSQSPEALVLAAVSNSNNTDTFETIDIFYPKKDALIPGLRPLFKGRVLPKKGLTLNIEPQGERMQLVADEGGLWSTTPQKNLTQGKHRLVMETIDERGKKVTRERTFTILKSGETVLGEATLEATITPIMALSPTPVSELTPTLIPTDILDITPTPTPPVSGVSFMTFSLLSFALILFGAGMILIF